VGSIPSRTHQCWILPLEELISNLISFFFFFLGQTFSSKPKKLGVGKKNQIQENLGVARRQTQIPWVCSLA